MAVVVFDYSEWIARFPEFNVAYGAYPAVSAYLAQSFFDEATLLFDNSDCSPMQNITKRKIVLYLLTAHIAYLSRMASTGNMLVGRVSSVSEGSVSISAEGVVGGSPSRAFYDQTRYGSLVWQMLAPFRTMRYIPGPAPNYNGQYPGLLPKWQP